MGLIDSIAQRREWIFMRENTTILSKNPEWHFAQMVAANDDNEAIQLEKAYTRLTPSTQNSDAQDDFLFVFDIENPTYRFAKKSPSLAQRMIKGNIFEMHYDASSLPTPYYMIHDRVVASIDNHEVFKRKIHRDISDWQTAMQKRLLVIFTSSLALGFIVSFVLLKVVCIALTVMAAVRLYQFYSMKKEHQGVFHVGQWAVQLWKAGKMDLTLVDRYTQAFTIFSRLQDRPIQVPATKQLSREELKNKHALIYRPVPSSVRTQPVQ